MFGRRLSDEIFFWTLERVVVLCIPPMSGRERSADVVLLLLCKVEILGLSELYCDAESLFSIDEIDEVPYCGDKNWS